MRTSKGAKDKEIPLRITERATRPRTKKPRVELSKKQGKRKMVLRSESESDSDEYNPMVNSGEGSRTRKKPTKKNATPTEAKPTSKSPTTRTSKCFGGTVQKLKIVSAIEIDWDALKALGLDEDLRWYLDQLGLRTFLELKKPAYDMPTRAFLNTITSIHDPHSSNACNGRIQFQYEGETYSLTIGEICELFGFPQVSTPRFHAHHSHAMEWMAFAGSHHDAGKSLASHIKHSVVRLVHILKPHSIFNRKETGKVLRDEFFLIAQPFVEPKLEANLGSIFVKRMALFRHISSDHTASITAWGGYITAIMEYMGIDLSNLTPEAPPKRLDLPRLQRFRFLAGWKKDPEQFAYSVFIEGQTHHISLPSPHISIQQHGPSFRLDDHTIPIPDITDFMPLGTYGRTTTHGRRLGAATTSANSLPLPELTRIAELENELKKQKETTAKLTRRLHQMARVLQRALPSCFTRPRGPPRGTEEPDTSLDFSFISVDPQVSHDNGETEHDSEQTVPLSEEEDNMGESLSDTPSPQF